MDDTSTDASEFADNGSKYRLLLPVSDVEAHGLAQARYAASLPGGDDAVVVTLTHVLHGEELETSREFRTAQNIGTVRHVRDWLTDHGIETEIRDVEYPYPPTRGIIALADKIDADAIVLSGHKRGVIESALLGSVVQSVMKDTTRPVVVVDPDTP